jgi:TP901 family phage tail tape measure protein
MANSIQYDYIIKDGYSRIAGKIKKATDRITAATKKASVQANKLGNNMKKAGDKMASAQNAMAGLGAGLALKGVIDTTNNFEEAMNNVNAITVASSESMARLRAQAKQLGATTQFSASQAADAMGFLGMAGLNTEKIMKAMPGTLQLAAAGGIELSQAADIATNVLAQMGMKVSELGKVNDALAATSSSANTSVLEMAEGLKNVGTTAAGLGINLNLTSALLGKMADAGVKSGEAGTLLRNAMTRAINPSKKARKVFRKLRIDMKEFTTPDGKLKNFTGLIEKLKTSGATTTDIFNAFEERGGRAILALLTSGGPAIDKLKKKIDDAGGAAERMAKTKMKGLPGAIKTLKSSFEGLVIAIGEKLTPFLIKASNKLSKMFSIIAEHPKMATLIAGLLSLGAAIPILMVPLGFLISGMGTLLTLITAITWPMIAIGGAIAIVTTAFVYWYKTGHPIIKTIKNITSMVLWFLKPLGWLISKLGVGGKTMNAFGLFFKATGAMIMLTIKPLELILTLVSNLFKVLGKLVTLDLKGAFGALTGGFDALKGVFGIGGGETEIASKKVIESSVDVKSQANQKVDIGGLIKVAAEKGSKVVSATPDMDVGTNMGFSY